ncbi:zinc-finger domain-containing protein [Wolbachia endosymbiont (group E) of Neria commutata]|uniref:zinc-finger domain-containing protein n=1 Tax=Wolbachia endosymbiont (group E) of Neria commutata TaxID=3066149 RepID=UPI003132E8E5
MSKMRINNRKVCCRGDENDEGFGHPLIYLDIGEEEEIVCPYCGKAFLYDHVEETMLIEEES